MASEKVLKFVEDIKELSVLELAELVDAIQEEFGVTAAVAAARLQAALLAQLRLKRLSSTLFWHPSVTLRWLLSRLLRKLWVWV